jgi:hypothetical protein
MGDGFVGVGHEIPLSYARCQLPKLTRIVALRRLRRQQRDRVAPAWRGQVLAIIFAERNLDWGNSSSGDGTFAGSGVEPAKYVQEPVHVKGLEENMHMGWGDGGLELAKTIVATFGKDGQFARARTGGEFAEPIDKPPIFGGIGNVNNQDVSWIVAKYAHGLISVRGGQYRVAEVHQQPIGRRFLRELITGGKNNRTQSCMLLDVHSDLSLALALISLTGKSGGDNEFGRLNQILALDRGECGASHGCY